MLCPAARSNSTVQVASVEPELFAIVYLPSYPVPQSAPLLKVALTPPAALAGTVTIPTASAPATVSRPRRCHLFLDITLLIGAVCRRRYVVWTNRGRGITKSACHSADRLSTPAALRLHWSVPVTERAQHVGCSHASRLFRAVGTQVREPLWTERTYSPMPSTRRRSAGCRIHRSTAVPSSRVNVRQPWLP